MTTLSPAQLQGMARAFAGGVPHPGQDATADGAHEAHVRRGLVEVDGQPVFEGPVPDTVAVSEDGQRTVFQVALDPSESRVTPGQPQARVMQAVRSRGWFGREKVEVLPAYNLPGPAAALDLDPRDGRLGAALAQDIVEVPWGTADWNVRATLPEPVLDFEYLHDGSVAVCTQPDQGLPRYYLVPPGGGAPVAVPLKQFDPEGFERQQCSFLPWSGVGVEDLPAFRAAHPWLFQADGSVAEHGATVSPSGRQALVVTVGEAGMARLYDGKTRTFTDLGQFDGRDVDRVQFLWDVDRGRAGAFVPQGEAGVLHLWDLQGGEPLVVPEVRDFRCDARQGTVSFVPPEASEAREFPLTDLGRVRQEAWWQDATRRHKEGLRRSTLGEAPAPAGDIVQEETAVTIGGIRLDRRS